MESEKHLQWISRNWCKVLITHDKRINKADALILPGVGAFGTAMKNLTKYEEIILKTHQDDKPLLGICLGFKLTFQCK